jgi:SagB-type dehydrogenase family enzyme
VSQEEERDAVLRYHELSTHQVHRYAPGPGFLDWANQPDPFRTYGGAPTVELPLADETGSPAWDALHVPGAVEPRPLGLASLGAFFELSLGLTAWKQYAGSRWALRANPSSGNLHPTEGYLLAPPAPDVPAGLYHYRSRDHVLERRFAPAPPSAATLERLLPRGCSLLGLASVHWREAWKYGVRAFRYCQHDAGHALAAARYAAGVVGWAALLLEAAGDADVAAILGLDREADSSAVAPADREHPEALVVVGPVREVEEVARGQEQLLDGLRSLLGDGVWTGRPSSLSAEHVAWPDVDTVAAATVKPRTSPAPAPFLAGGAVGAPPAAPPARRARSAVRLIRQRRSALAMDAATALPSATLFAMLERLIPAAGVPPWDVLPWRPRVHPVLFVHRVEGLAPGLYVLERSETAHDSLRASLRAGFGWVRPEGTPASLRLFLLEEGDARPLARLASCHQEIASDSAFSLGMLAAFSPSLEGAPWNYRRLFWEAGVLGQALYLEAEAADVRATGIGCYFDDVVHEVLGLEGGTFRDLYHFTVGGAVDDPRLTTLPAHPEAVRARGLRPRSGAAPALLR